MLLDQFPKARIVDKSPPAFCKKNADKERISLAVDVDDDFFITILIHPAIVSVAAGV